jgi:predicted alpha/beta-hydrolase family hydrolase
MSALSSPAQIVIPVSETIGSVSASIQEATKPKAMLTLAHGAGAGKDHPFMLSLAAALAAESISTLRFNFPYMEQGKRRPDPGPIAEKTIESVLLKTHALFPKLPLYGAGKSFGGRMTSQYISKQGPSWVHGLIFFGFPLHPAGAPAITRADHLGLIKKPMLFLQGTCDTLAELPLLKGVVKKLPTSTLTLFEGADHSFKIGKRQLMEELALAASTWIDRQ